jgi:SAM-dependent methyltransferase
VAWARAPNHDAFWAYTGALTSFIGPGPGLALEVGCGEGRVSRLLKLCDYHVTAADPVAELVEAARDADSADRYIIATAGNLPFDDQSFDLVVAYNMLMDVENVPAAVEEMARVLRSDGTLMISIVHPIADLELPASLPSEGVLSESSYFTRRRFENKEESGGLRMRFAGWTQPLEAYAAALEGAGLAIVSLREPVADCGEGRRHMDRWSRLPLFLWLKARNLTR